MSGLVSSLDVQHPLTLLERRMYGHLILYCCIAHRSAASFGTRDLGCVLCCVYDLVWNLKTCLLNVLNTGQVRLLTAAPIH